MKIVDLAEFYSERGGGVRAYLSQLLREGTRRGHEVVVIAPGPYDEETELHGGRVIRLAGPPMPYDPSYHVLWRLREVRALIQRERPDVLQASSPYVAAPVATTVRDVPVRSLVLHSDFIEVYARPVLSRAVGPRATATLLTPPWKLFRALTARFDHTVVSGEWLAEKLRRRGCHRVACVPFGIAHANFGAHLRDESLRGSLLARHTTRDDAALVAVVGRLAIEKRVGFVLRALAEVARVRPVVALVLGDGPERPRLEALARELSLPVHFMGFVNDRVRYASLLASSDALVHGCESETFGFSVAEALASGVPVVIPDLGGAAEFADPACSESFSADGLPMDAAVATRRLLERPREVLSGAAVAAAHRIRGAGAHFDALFALYEESLRSRT